MVSDTLPSKGPNSPFSAGPRTLLARTCTVCGELYDGDSFPVLNASTKNKARRKTCHICHNRQKKRNRIQRGIGNAEPRPPVDKQTNKYRFWTAEDDKYLRENIHRDPYEAIALALGRSLLSVYNRRTRLGIANIRTSHRVDKPWRIENES